MPVHRCKGDMENMLCLRIKVRLCVISCLSYFLVPGLKGWRHQVLRTWNVQWSSTHSRDHCKGYWDTFWLWRQQYSWLVAAATYCPTGGAFRPRKGNKLAPVAKEWCYRRSATRVHVLSGFFRAHYLWKHVGFSDADRVSEAVQLVAVVPGDVVKVVHVCHLDFGRRLGLHCTSERSSEHQLRRNDEQGNVWGRHVASISYPHHTEPSRMTHCHLLPLHLYQSLVQHTRCRRRWPPQTLPGTSHTRTERVGLHKSC